MQDKKSLNILIVGDIVGKPGRRAVFTQLESLIKENEIDITIANGENTAGGLGITPNIVKKLYKYGVDVITTGNHIWKNKEIINEINNIDCLLRPVNFPPGVPGKGYTIIENDNISLPVCVVNLMGRINISHLDCPFRKMDEVLEIVKEKTKIIIVDFHAETTSEKVAMGYYLDGRVSAVFGTHTHVQTADERILPGGTAYITDVGMTGPKESIIGMDSVNVLNHFIKQMPFKFKVAGGDLQFNGILLKIDKQTGIAEKIERINITIQPQTDTNYYE